MKPVKKLFLLWALTSGLFVGAMASECNADRFQLKDGRILTGKVVHSDKVTEGQKEETRLAIEVEPGVLVRVYESDLASSGGHVKLDPREEEYLKAIAKLPETAEDHYRAAQWCAKQGLRDLAQAHYLRVIELDPNHKLARAAVDHTLSSDTGRWIRREDQMSERGKVYYKGKWTFPEYIPMDDQAEKDKQEQLALQKNISRWHTDALRGSDDKVRQAFEQIMAIDNPLASEYIGQLLLDKQKGGLQSATPQLKLAYVSVLAKFNLPAAIVPLARASVTDADQSVRTACLDALSRQGRLVAIQVILPLLRSRNNEQVNLAGYALGQLGASEAILPLVEALVTRHEFQGSSADTYSTGGLSLGGPRKKVLDLENQSVLSALTQITEQGSFGFDKAQWKSWYASVYAPPADDLRRDP